MLHAHLSGMPGTPFCERLWPGMTASMQPELAVDGADLGRPDQPRMGNGDRMQRSFKRLEPEIEEFVECRKCRAEIVVLPDIGLKEPRMIRPPVEDIGRGQSIAF